MYRAITIEEAQKRFQPMPEKAPSNSVVAPYHDVICHWFQQGYTGKECWDGLKQLYDFSYSVSTVHHYLKKQFPNEPRRWRNQNVSKTHCKRGHDLSDAYIGVNKRTGKAYRDCKACDRERAKPKTHCRNGHAFENNFYLEKRFGRMQRTCKTCQVERNKRYLERKKRK